VRNVVTWAVALGVIGVLSGCATASTGTSQSIKVGSTPDGAECVFTRDGQTLQKITTPGSITVKRDKRPITVVCAKDGYEESRAVMNSQTEFQTVGGPGIIGGIIAIGALVDMSSGANNRYQTALMVNLEPLSSADAAAAAARPKPPAVPPQPERAPPPTSPQVATAAAPTVYRPGPWKARLALAVDKSAGNCAKDGGSYSLDLTGDLLTVDNVNGRMFKTPVPSDGAVDHAFKSPSGASLKLVGNARTRDLEIVNSNFGCRWKLVSES
jgi:hypothetical protein